MPRQVSIPVTLSIELDREPGDNSRNVAAQIQHRLDQIQALVNQRHDFQLAMEVAGPAVHVLNSPDPIDFPVGEMDIREADAATLEGFLTQHNADWEDDDRQSLVDAVIDYLNWGCRGYVYADLKEAQRTHPDITWLGMLPDPRHACEDLRETFGPKE
jgi:uncharacterized protein YutD